LGKIETIIALSSIIGVAALLLQNKTAIGDTVSNVKESLTFGSSKSTGPTPTTPDDSSPSTNVDSSPSTDIDSLPSAGLLPVSLIPTPTKTIVNQVTPIIPVATIAHSAVRQQGTTSIQGTVRSEIETNQKFSVFSADSSRPVRGVIRETKRDPRNLKVDSRKNPLETASQRANRVFVTTGKFADESRGASSLSSSQRAILNRATTPIQTNQTSSRLSIADRLKAEAEKATKVFESSSISNF